MARKVLVVDDQDAIREILRSYLVRDGYEVLEASTGQAALGIVKESNPEVILLDVGLPDMDGIEVMRQLRQFSDAYVIFVTARSEEVDRLVGLSVGADDYVTKPFSPREVVARVGAMLRRSRNLGSGDLISDPSKELPEDDSTWVFDDLTISPDRREVILDGEELSLTALEFDILATLAETPGRVFSRHQILENVWGYDFYGDERVVDVHIRALRKILGDDASAPTFIGTVRQVGYKFLKARS